ncbi:MAG TPA: pyridoxamine 5'-phosphate oxidase [Vicinamibacterales bacterium]|nr:pyridoxamine 5'-phosphate oxidase [Vicinamibacterales bacterium]
MTTLADLRREYASRALNEEAADRDPIKQFGVWFAEAMNSELLDVNAMTLATATPGGEPAARIVLLKGVDEGGFVFYTNYQSAKGRELDANPRASLLLFWAELERQVRITGAVSKTTRAESEAYFQSRPFESRLSAALSPQSRPVASRADLETQYAELLSRHADGHVPLPAFWGGYRVRPERVEFWQGRKSRLHDRLLYVRQPDGTWLRSRLAP